MKTEIIKPTNQQLAFLRLALGMVGVGVESQAGLAKIWIVMKQLEKLGGSFDILNAVDIEIFVDKKWRPKKVTVTPHPDEKSEKTSKADTSVKSSDQPDKLQGRKDS